MKRAMIFKTAILGLVIYFFIPINTDAQEEDTSSPFSVGADLVSSYLWRGSKFGTGPAIQPYVELDLGNLAIGAWGSYCFTTNEAAEADLYLSYGFDFGLSVGVTDYYYQGTDYFNFIPDDVDSTGAHAFEINLGYEIAGFSVSANYMLNEAFEAGSAGSDLYFELGYSFDSFGLFVGGGNGWHTSDGGFAVCNVGLIAFTELQLTEKFSLPVSGSVILNPDKEQFHIVLGVSF